MVHSKTQIEFPLLLLLLRLLLLLLLLYGWHGNADCFLVAPNLKFNFETVVKSAKINVWCCLSSLETLRLRLGAHIIPSF